MHLSAWHLEAAAMEAIEKFVAQPLLGKAFYLVARPLGTTLRCILSLLSCKTSMCRQ
jgi:hypothetical protein